MRVRSPSIDSGSCRPVTSMLTSAPRPSVISATTSTRRLARDVHDARRAEPGRALERVVARVGDDHAARAAERDELVDEVPHEPRADHDDVVRRAARRRARRRSRRTRAARRAPRRARRRRRASRSGPRGRRRARRTRARSPRRRPGRRARGRGPRRRPTRRCRSPRAPGTTGSARGRRRPGTCRAPRRRRRRRPPGAATSSGPRLRRRLLGDREPAGLLEDGDPHAPPPGASGSAPAPCRAVRPSDPAPPSSRTASPVSTSVSVPPNGESSGTSVNRTSVLPP